MHPLIEKILEKPTSHKLGIWIASLLVLAIAIYQFLVGPARTASEDLDTKVQSIRSKITQEQRRANDLPRLREQVRELDMRFSAALKELPDSREVPELLLSIERLARDSGLEVTLFQTRPEVVKDFYADVPVLLNAQGTFHQLMTFLDEVGHLERIVNVSDLDVWQPLFRETNMIKELSEFAGTGRVPIRASAVATTFRYLDESERKAVEEKKQVDSKKKRRSKK